MRALLSIAGCVVAIGVGSYVLIGALGPQSTAHAAPNHGSQPTKGQANCQDADGDGYGLGCAKGPDCNDADPTIHPGQVETCNFRDDDCSGIADDSPACAEPPLVPGKVRVSASRFLMGSAEGEGAKDEHPRHAVRVSAFSMDRYEVTNVRYRACVKAGKCAPPVRSSSHLRPSYFEDPKFDDYPVIFVNHDQAKAFCAHDGGRLPTEAEWELAARGPEPQARVFPWGNQAPDCAHANMGGPGSCIGDTDRVGKRPDGASFFGVMDMAGNVWEWVEDWYDPGYYGKSPSQDPKGPEKGSLKVMRGGCWESTGDSLRVSCRKAELPGTWAYNVGFRCVFPGEG